MTNKQKRDYDQFIRLLTTKTGCSEQYADATFHTLSDGRRKDTFNSAYEEINKFNVRDRRLKDLEKEAEKNP